jgi:uncharacterized protein (TIGR02996 family)
MTADEQALLRNVLVDPAADLWRLVYAGWLEEHGQPERAEFVRLQIEVVKTPSNLPTGAVVYDAGRPIGIAMHEMPNPVVTGALRRATAIWNGGLPGFRGGLPAGFRYYLWATDRSGSPDLTCLVSRGFVSSISLTLTMFLHHAEAIFRTHPVTSVRLVDREPREFAPVPLGPDGPYFWAEAVEVESQNQVVA